MGDQLKLLRNMKTSTLIKYVRESEPALSNVSRWPRNKLIIFLERMGME